MRIVKTKKELGDIVGEKKAAGLTVGFVPTMGALHDGHLSLVEEARKDSDFVVVSIFVNPTQFNNPEDLETYPRDLDKDIKLLEKYSVEVVFAPSVEEMYPEEDTRHFDFGQLDKVMEGKYRPGHFNGVAQVVSKLFDYVKPDKAFFGEKDFQQLAIIRRLVKDLGMGVEVVGCPIVREPDGLAMSSRNQLLTPEMRKNAPVIAKTLFDSLNFAAGKTVKQTRDAVVNRINETNMLKVEYFDIVDGDTLQTVENWDDSDYIVGCIAVFAGKVRLIDNVTYKNRSHEH
ncbi:MAG: pantoate--beta-alanine ligase [Chlorobi bacterium]|nr:pantoate--beta-alanine ligase [Chlorobiota bacterium]